MTSDLIKRNEPLNSHCSYKTGGKSAYFAEPKDNFQLKYVLEWAAENQITFEVIGGGTNLLISDSGYEGLIISTESLNMSITSDTVLTVSCGAGIKLLELINFAILRGMKGMEKLSGIPGCIGGGLTMNAGAFGSEMKDFVREIYVMDYFGKESTLSAAEAIFSYRKSEGLKGYIITGGLFYFEQGEKETLERERNEILKRRKEKQPLNKPSCGSVFKRPATGYAGDFIERCGLKGFRVGGAVVSEKHANFILNDKDASSADIKQLIDIITENVQKEFGVILEAEVKFIGFK